jgi:hypothetical protein
MGGATTAIPSGSGQPLQPGDSGVAWPANAYYDLNEIFIDADNANDGVQFVIGVN